MDAWVRQFISPRILLSKLPASLETRMVLLGYSGSSGTTALLCWCHLFFFCGFLYGEKCAQFFDHGLAWMFLNVDVELM